MAQPQAWPGLADHSLCILRLLLSHSDARPGLQGSQPDRWGVHRIKRRPAVYKYVVFLLACPSSVVLVAAALATAEPKVSSLPTNSHPEGPSRTFTNLSHLVQRLLTGSACVTNLCVGEQCWALERNLEACCALGVFGFNSFGNNFKG